MDMIGPVVRKVGLQVLLEPQTSGVMFRAACSTVGVIYPAYQSFKAIEDNKEQQKAKEGNQADEQWLTYWTIYGMLSLAEGLTDDVLGRFPYYYHGKFVLLCWLQMPSTQGAKLLYTRHMRPVLQRFRPKIDVCLDRTSALLGALYTLYRLPIEQGIWMITLAASKGKDFVTWFLENSGPENGAAAAGGDKGAQQGSSASSGASNDRRRQQFIAS